MKDNEFVNYFMAILGVLVAVAAIILVLANSLADSQQTMDMAMLERTKERIAPIGQVNIGSVPAQKASMSATAGKTDAVAFSAEGVYQAVCHACHGTGVLESPRLDDTEAWKTRMAKGIDNVYQMAINGIGNMPPKGGRTDLSDANFKQIIDYMLKQAGVSP
ncbi:MAG: cytochrome c5 family protein [Chromatiales bacterium]|nr:cytochrome c5 family protein [Chromatiales bacterium]